MSWPSTVTLFLTTSAAFTLLLCSSSSSQRSRKQHDKTTTTTTTTTTTRGSSRRRKKTKGNSNSNSNSSSSSSSSSRTKTSTTSSTSNSTNSTSDSTRRRSTRHHRQLQGPLTLEESSTAAGGFHPFFLARARHRLSFDATTTAVISSTSSSCNSSDKKKKRLVTGANVTTDEKRTVTDQQRIVYQPPSERSRPTGCHDDSCRIPTRFHHHHHHFQESSGTPNTTTTGLGIRSDTTSSGSRSHSHMHKKEDATLQSFAHFHDLLVQEEEKDDSLSLGIATTTTTTATTTTSHNNNDYMEQVTRKSTPVEKLLHQQAKHSFNSTFSSFDNDHEDDDYDKEDEEEEEEDGSRSNSSSCSSCCSDTSNTTLPTSNKNTTTTTTTNHNNNNNEIIHASRFSVWRSTYNSKIMPNQVILVRHGQSEGNINEAIYAEKPDSEISLTRLGWEQAKMAGKALKQEIFNRQKVTTSAAATTSIHFIVSPYVRTMETFHGLVSAWCDPDVEFAQWETHHERKMKWYSRLKDMGITWHEDPRIREQDFGNYQEQHIIDKAKVERHKFGAFYYRFPNGESASDVYDRASTFLDSLWRSFDANRSQNYVLVTHGISVRVLLMRYFRYSIDQFYMIANPRNCEMIILGHDGKGRLELDGRCDLELIETKKTKTTEDDDPNHKDNDAMEHNNNNNNNNNNPINNDGTLKQEMESKSQDEDTTIKVHGYKFYKRLRIVPEHHMRTRTIRLSYKG